MNNVAKISKKQAQPPPKRKFVINVSPEVFEHIAKNSRPLIDTPDSTLRRLFGLPDKKSLRE